MASEPDPAWSQPHTIQLPKFSGGGASLSYIEGGREIPFSIRRIYYLAEVKKWSIRGEHAHRDLEQLVIAINGAFDMVVSNGERQWRFHLRTPDQALYIPPLHWGVLNNFSGGAACLVLASDTYDPDDYLTTFADLRAEVSRRSGAPGGGGMAVTPSPLPRRVDHGGHGEREGATAPAESRQAGGNGGIGAKSSGHGGDKGLP